MIALTIWKHETAGSNWCCGLLGHWFPSFEVMYWRLLQDNPEDEGGNFLRNVGKQLPKHTVQQPIGPGSSIPKLIKCFSTVSFPVGRAPTAFHYLTCLQCACHLLHYWREVRFCYFCAAPIERGYGEERTLCLSVCPSVRPSVYLTHTHALQRWGMTGNTPRP